MSNNDEPRNNPFNDPSGGNVDNGFPTGQLPPRTDGSDPLGYPDPHQHNAPTQPQQGYGQQQPPPYGGGPSQPYVGYGEPPKKSKTGLIFVVVGVLLALLIGGIVWALTRNGEEGPSAPVATSASAVPTQGASDNSEVTEEATPEPTAEPTEAATTPEEPSQDPSAATKPTTSAQPPVDVPAEVPEDLPALMPETVGSFTSLGVDQDFSAYFDADANQSVVVVWTKEWNPNALPDAEDIGRWACVTAEDPESASCVTQSFGGTLVLTGGLDIPSAVAFGDEFMSAWK